MVKDEVTLDVVDGQYHGEFISYWPNGQKREEGRLQQGERVGVFKSWSVEGVLINDKNHDLTET